MESKKQTKQILVRVSELEHKTIKEIAESKRISMNQFIVDVIFDSINSGNDSGNNENDSAIIEVFKNELEEKNSQIDKLHELLNQQQILSLNTQKEKESLLLEIDNEAQDEPNQSFWSRLFRS